MNAASLVWLVAAALGLGALVRANPHVFRVIPVLVMDVVAMSGYALAGGALAAALMQPKARRAFSATVGALLLAAAAMIVLRA